MKAFVLNSVLVFLIAVFSLPVLVVYMFVFFALGGGWAYGTVETGGCHFVVGPIGYAMLVLPGVLLGRGAWKSYRKLRRHR